MNLRLRAPAKLNLGLRILGVRPDGFHDIRSVFQEISLADMILLRTEAGCGRISLCCPGSCLPEDGGNLAWKAAESFLSATGLGLDVSMEVHKRIPLYAGLGGGSSDAASVLTGLAEATGADIDLAPLAESLGSDVPFFLKGGAALVEGRGERLSPLPAIRFHAVLLHPRIRVSTPWAYAEWDLRSASLTGRGPVEHDSALSAAWHEGKPFPHGLWNDFLPLLEERFPEIAALARFLRGSCESWGLSGSGPTLYALFRTELQAERFSEELPGGIPFTMCRSAEAAGASSNW